MPRAWAVVPAAGCGERFGDGCPKQFTVIQGHTLISYTISSLLVCDEVEKVIVVISDQSRVGSLPLWWRLGLKDEQNIELPRDQTSKTLEDSDQVDVPQHCHKVCSDELNLQPMNETGKMQGNKECEMTFPSPENRVVYVAGSTSRHRSIKCGLDAIEQLVQNGSGPAPDVVLVHDGVRPLVPARLVSSLVSAAAADGAAGLTRPLVSTVLETPPGHHGRLERSLERSRHRASETPQAFSYPVIRRAYQQCSEHELDHGTECLQLALTHTGVAARLLDGSPDLWKVTYRHDLHAFRGVLDDTRIRLAVVSTKASLDDTRDSLVRLLPPRVPRVAAIPASELTTAGRRYSCLVLLRPAATAGIAAGAAAGAAEAAVEAVGAAALEAAARQLDRRLRGYVVDVRVGWVERADPADAVAGPADAGAEAEEFIQRTGKWLCRVDCSDGPADCGRRLAALLTAILPSEEGAFHGQVLRV